MDVKKNLGGKTLSARELQNEETGEAFGVIYADPPWEYRHKVTGRNGRGAASHHYNTLTFEERVRKRTYFEHKRNADLTVS